jgi:tetratricopeptide (TPR) repeat protein
LSVAVDLRGAEVVKPFVAGTDFTTVVDPENKLANLFGFKVVPNGIFVDENGVVRMMKQTFHVTNEEHVGAIEQLIRGEIETAQLDDKSYTLQEVPSDLKIQLAQTKFKLGTEYAKQDKNDEALKELDEALLLDPDNFLIRKQRWYIRYPEKFSPVIDFEWQKGQLEKERAEEAAKANSEDCGPDGCEIRR